MRAERAMLRAAAWLAPPAVRAEWLAEWESELWYAAAAGGRTVRFCLGAFRDAYWLRRHPPIPAESRPRLQSPWACAGLLALLAAACAYWAPAPAGGTPFGAQEMVFCIALAILPATTPLALGDAAPRAGRLSRWGFLALKFALLTPMVFFGTRLLGRVLSAGGLQAQALLVGYVLAFRWALIDQRARCPVCLRRLEHPARIGGPSHVFLEWYGTEFLCTRGHGLLHVPEIPTSSYPAPRWMALDASWKQLFP